MGSVFQQRRMQDSRYQRRWFQTGKGWVPSSLRIHPDLNVFDGSEGRKNLVRCCFCNLEENSGKNLEESWQMMMKRDKMEKDLVIGTEVGYSKNAETAREDDPRAVVVGQPDVLCSLGMHSWYLVRLILKFVCRKPLCFDRLRP
ncbi:hypothetical protein C2845_PM05G07710 [Panicum miliaceum]|uniref:Uncharacterized protein n=1 Tax=Panicum miliaceum TaxID=4540 RepID=A0A3L6T1G7_PANMI|nr:hypothetical protein C2845_PM05G07710 [Panicum miliaceum]